MTSSGRPFELIDVRVVDEEGNDVAKDSQQVGWLLSLWAGLNSCGTC